MIFGSNSCSLNGKGKLDPTMLQKWSAPDSFSELVVPTDLSRCDHNHTVSHIVNSCPFSRLEGSWICSTIEAKDDAVN